MVIAVGIALLVVTPRAHAQPVFETEIDARPTEREYLVRIRFDPSGVKKEELLQQVHEPVLEPSGEPVDGSVLLRRVGGAGTLVEPGAPELPVVTVQIPLERGTRLEIAAIDTADALEWSACRLAPATEPWSEAEDAPRPPRVCSGDAYRTDALYPPQLAEVGPAGSLRDADVGVVHVTPLRVNPVRRLAVLQRSIKLRVRVVRDPGADREPSLREYSSAFARTYAKFAGQEFDRPPGANVAEVPVVDGCDYLIITAPMFREELKRLVDAKTDRGLVVRTLTFDAPVPGQEHEARKAIRDMVLAEYAKTPAPSYLLIVGDTKHVPTWLASVHPESDQGHVATDMFYATMDGPADVIPDLAVGRLPADTAPQLRVMIDKILTYAARTQEAEPWGTVVIAAEYQWGKRAQGGTMDERYFLQTSVAVADFLTRLEYPVTTVYAMREIAAKPWFYRDGKAIPDIAIVLSQSGGQALTAAWADDLRFVMHRDHGEPRGWVTPPFRWAAPPALATPTVPPIVFSINCSTGRFDDDKQTCLAEDLMRAANGACAVIAATRVSYSGYNDRLAEGLVVGLWPTFELSFNPFAPRVEAPETPRLGPLLDAAKQHMRNEYPKQRGARFANLTAELFQLFGDPDMPVLERQQRLEESSDGPAKLLLTKWLERTPVQFRSTFDKRRAR